MLQPHRVIAAFISGRQQIVPPAEWTPPSQAVADRLIAAGCLRVRTAIASPGPTMAPPVSVDTVSTPVVTSDADKSTETAADVVKPDPKDKPHITKSHAWGRGSKSRGK